MSEKAIYRIFIALLLAAVVVTTYQGCSLRAQQQKARAIVQEHMQRHVADPCDTAIVAHTCGDGVLHCPTDVATAKAALIAADAGDYICIAGEIDGGPAGGIYTLSENGCLVGDSCRTTGGCVIEDCKEPDND